MDASPWIILEGRLLTQAALRNRLREDPGSVGREAGLSESEIQYLRSLDLEALERQARGLVLKRMHEVAQLLPGTRLAMNATWERLFFEYANESAWPKGHQRHWRDALSFAEWLARRGERGLVRAEWLWARFVAEERRLRIHLLRERRIRIAVFIRIFGSHSRAFFVRLG